MSINQNNFLQHVTFEGIDFSTTSSPFRSSDDCDTKSDTPFSSSLSSSYSNKLTTHFDLDHGAIVKSFKPKPFKIIRATREERQEMIKLSNQSKKIQKRVKAKERMQVKQEIAVLLLKAPKKYIPAGIQDPNMSDRERRRLMQKLKNRIASQQTRDQRKKHISELEEVKMHLEKANKELNEKNKLLNDRNSELEELLRAVQNEKLLLIEENNELKQRGIACFDSTKATSDSRIDDPQKYFDFSEDKHDGNAPSPTLTRKNKYQGHYFNFLLGVLTICIARSDMAIQVGQETVSHKITIQSTRSEVPGVSGIPSQSYERESFGSSYTFGSSQEKSEPTSKSVKKKRSKKNFNEDINYYVGEVEESVSTLFNLSAKASHDLYSSSLLSSQPETSQKNNNLANEIYAFNSKESVSHLGSYQQNNYESGIYKVSYKNSTISHKNNDQHINSINEIYQSLHEDQIEEEKTHQLARAGRASRVDTRNSGLRAFFISILLIFLFYFVSYKFKIVKQWNQLKNHSIKVCKKIAKEGSENKMIKQLEAKMIDLYAKYIVKRS